MPLGSNIRKRRKALKLTLEDMAHRINWDTGNLSRLERGTQGTSQDRLRQIAAVLGCTIADLYQEESNVVDGPSVRGEVPVVSWVEAGNPQEAIDNYAVGHGEDILHVTVPVKRHTYALRVKNDSMTAPPGVSPSFPEGIYVVVEPDIEACHKDFVIVKSAHETEATFKQLIIDGNDAYLKPLNPNYTTKPFPRDGRISGVVREAIWKLK